MKSKIWNKRYVHNVLWFLGISCVMLLSACGEKSADNGMTTDISAAEEPVCQESGQEDADEPVQTESPKYPEESEQTQDEGEKELQEKTDYAVQNETRLYEGTEILGLDHGESFKFCVNSKADIR